MLPHYVVLYVGVSNAIELNDLVGLLPHLCLYVALYIGVSSSIELNDLVGLLNRDAIAKVGACKRRGILVGVGVGETDTWKKRSHEVGLYVEKKRKKDDPLVRPSGCF